MVYRGCIVKLEENYAIVLTNTMDYVKVVKKEGLEIGKSILFVKEDVYQEKKQNFTYMRAIAAVIMIMIISLTMLSKWSFFNHVSSAAAAVISVDINPSVELEINKEAKVIKAIPINNDGKQLIDRNLKGMEINEAIWIIINNAKLKNYITAQKNAVLISSAIIDEDYTVDDMYIQEQIEFKWKQDEAAYEISIVYMEGNKEDLDQSRKKNISIGKYEVYKESSGQNKEVTIEKIKGMKVQDLVDNGIIHRKEKPLKANVPQKDKEHINTKDKEEKDSNQNKADKNDNPKAIKPKEEKKPKDKEVKNKVDSKNPEKDKLKENESKKVNLSKEKQDEKKQSELMDKTKKLKKDEKQPNNNNEDKGKKSLNKK